MRPDEVEFWDADYRTGRLPWDFHGAPSALAEYLCSVEEPGWALIPGCGSGHEVRTFHERGWQVLAVDFAPAAVARARNGLGTLEEKVVQADFFTHDFGGRKFDLIYERAFLCTISPERWTAYSQRTAELLAENGKLVGFFLYGHEDDPPPYPLTEEAAQAVLAKKFVRLLDESVTDSLPVFAGRERWQVWQKKGVGN
jgi:SAM-dependent methyltransferase